MLPGAALVIVSKLVLPVLRIPSVKVRVAEERGPERVTPFGLLTVRLLNAVTLDGTIIPVDDPPNIKVDEDVVLRLFGVPAIAGPLRVSELAATAKVPAVSVRLPLTVAFPERVFVPDPEIVRFPYVKGRTDWFPDRP